MNMEAFALLFILVSSVILFVGGRWRHDVGAVGALLACVLAGRVPPREAFAGFGHPAVVTVACVLVLNRALQNSGAVDVLTAGAPARGSSPAVTLAVLRSAATATGGPVRAARCPATPRP